MPPRVRGYPGGFFVPEGWKSFVLPALDALEALRADIHTCREHFGCLKIWVRDPTPEMQAIYMPAIARSNVTCEDCGAPGVLRCSQFGHLKTCCNAHPPEAWHRERDRRNYWDL